MNRSTASGIELNVSNIVNDINRLQNATVPVGTIIWSSNANVPNGYLLCNGSSVGRATYPELFAVIGTRFGSGDGETTFNLPNLIGKFIEGSNVAGTEHEAGLPNITGSSTGVSVTVSSNFPDTDALSHSTTDHLAWSYQANNSKTQGWGTLELDASKSNSIYGNSDTVQPPSVTALPCIRAFSEAINDGTVVVTELANEVAGKVNLNGSNLTNSTIQVVIETWHEGTEWYRVWSDGWCEQGGELTASSDTNNLSKEFFKPFSDTNYTITASYVTTYNGSANTMFIAIKTKSPIGFTYACGSNHTKNWYACGYISLDEESDGSE